MNDEEAEFLGVKLIEQKSWLPIRWAQGWFTGIPGVTIRFVGNLYPNIRMQLDLIVLERGKPVDNVEGISFFKVIQSALKGKSPNTNGDEHHRDDPSANR